MNNAHHTRLHSVWAASATSRNSVCAGAIALSSLCEERESEAAAWGSCAHQISERCLRGSLEAISFLGGVEKHGKFEFPIDEDMINTAQEYVDYVRQESKDCLVGIEQKLSLEKLNPPLESGGTGDAVIYNEATKHLEIVDLKGGRGVVVEAVGNTQMRTYALGAMLTLSNLIVERIKVTIVQPRAGHKDGRIRSETFHVADLIDWSVDLLGLMQRAKDALDEFAEIGGNAIKFEEWAAKWLKTGQCIFCPAKAICPAIKAEALSIAGAAARKWFEEPSDGEPLVVGNAPALASPEELAHVLDGLDMLESWIKSYRAYAHAEAEKGVEIPGYQLSQRIGNRKWRGDDVEVSEALAALGVTEKQMFEESLRSPAQIEKILGAKRKGEIDKLVVRPVTGTNLVASSKTTRPPVASKVEAFFEPVK